MPTEPAGALTFLFTDIEGSTHLARTLGDRRYSETLAEHRRILREAVAASAGQEVDTQGDGFFVAFRSAADGIRAALAAQQALHDHPWPSGTSLRVRMGLHTSVPVSAEGRYVGVGVHRAARICQASHGGQVLLSQTTADLVEGDLPDGVSLRDLGEFRLKDMAHAERVLQLVGPGIPAFPSVRAVSVRTSRLRGAALLAALVIVVGGAAFLSRGYLGSKRLEVNSIAVLPLENLSGDPTQEYLADGMTEALITTLGQVRALRVISRTSVMQFKGTKQALPEIARQLGVDAIIEGSVARAGPRVRVTAQLIHAPTDRHLWSRSYDRDFTDIISLQNEIARTVVGEIQKELTPAEEARLAPKPVDVEAQDAYLRGLYEFNKPRATESRLASIAYFTRAVEKDPQHAPAWATMAVAYVELSYAAEPAPTALEYVNKAKAAALMAVQSDPNLAEAHAAVGYAITNFKETKAAAAAYRRALELNSNSWLANRSYADLFLFLGRMPEAVRYIRRAYELDPLNINMGMSYANYLFFARRYDEALAQTNRVLEVEPEFAFMYNLLGRIYVEKGMHHEAVDALRKSITLGFRHPGNLGVLGRAYVLLGDRAEARKLLGELKERAEKNPTAETAQAIIYTTLGEKTEAIAALERGRTRGDTDLAFLARVAPWFDSLRSDPRYQAFERAFYEGD